MNLTTISLIEPHISNTDSQIGSIEKRLYLPKAHIKRIMKLNADVIFFFNITNT